MMEKVMVSMIILETEIAFHAMAFDDAIADFDEHTRQW